MSPPLAMSLSALVTHLGRRVAGLSAYRVRSTPMTGRNVAMHRFSAEPRAGVSTRRPLLRPVGDGANRKRQVANLAMRMGLLFSCEDVCVIDRAALSARA